jgi:uncharacterized membrane protein YjgN (DUF898 family)
MSPELDVHARSGSDIVTLHFTGEAGEYFRIWIVNVCLSVVTLGIYSAWAKVRRKKYFYGNTLLNGAAFEYLADPKAILRGRLLVAGAYTVYVVLSHFGGMTEQENSLAPLYFLLLLLFLAVVMSYLPQLIIRALAFNARNTSHRNVRFRFARGDMPSDNRFPTLLLYTWPLTLGLLYPYYAYRKRAFVLTNTAYGTTRFSFDATPGDFYWLYFKLLLWCVCFYLASAAVAGAFIYASETGSRLFLVTACMLLLPLYILFASYRDAAMARLYWQHTRLGKLHFRCGWRTWDLFKLHFVNSLGIIFTVGLLAPWAAIRAARYQLHGISLQPARELDGFTAAMTESVAATGAEAVELLGFDFSL